MRRAILHDLMKSQQGGALVVALIAAAVVAIVIMSNVSAFSHMTKTQNTVAFHRNAEAVLSKIRLALVVSPHCRANLASLPVGGVGAETELGDLFYSTPAGGLTADPIVRLNVYDEVNRVTLIRLRFVTQEVLSVPSTVLASLEATFRTEGAYGGTDVIKAVPLFLRVTGGAVEDCSTATMIPRCPPTTTTTSTGTPATLGEGLLTQEIPIDTACECKCRITGWSCACRQPGPPGTPGTPGPPGGGGGSGNSGDNDGSGDSDDGDGGGGSGNDNP